MVPDQLTWRVPRKKKRSLELDKLMADLDTSQSGGAGVILFEMDRRSLGEARRLMGELAARWKSRDKRLLIVDAHPAEPFLPGNAEGFSEMLHYGLSPASLLAPFPGLDADYIGAGGMGELAPPDPAEPARSLRRLAASRDRVILLADSRDAEGMLKTLIEESAFRLRLSDPELDEHLERLAARRSAGRQRLLLFLGLPLLVVLIYMLLPDEESGGEIRIDSPPVRTIRALAEKAELPYYEGGRDEGSEPADTVGLATLLSGTGLSVHTDQKPAPAETGGQTEVDTIVEAESDTDAQVTVTGKPAPYMAHRRGESRADWKSALDHKGSFHLHVSSFRDSNRALLAQDREGYAGLPVRIHPVFVKGQTWYRVLVGCFPDLLSAAAFRDSLLDQAGKDFCVIGIDPEP